MHDTNPNVALDHQPLERRLLDRHRRDIEALDRRILHLVCERLELARQVGVAKQSLGLPLRNFEVETQVRGRFERACAELGLDSAVGSELALFLIDKAVEEQACQQEAQPRGGALDTVVVGGKGGMGRWIARFLAGQGHRVRVVDPAPEPSPFGEAAGLAEAAAGADLLVLAVPMATCAAVLEELAGLGTTAVVAEMCSLKSHLAPVAARVRARGLRLVSFHPMFGPDVRMLSGRTVVFCNDAEPADLAVVRGLFEGTSASLVSLDAAEHDRRMAVVLGLTHLSNLVFARAVARSGIDAAALAEVAGVTFARQLGTTREVSAENPQLYYQIQAFNEFTPEALGWLGAALEEWRGAVDAADGGASFGELMQECRRSLATS